MAWKSDFPVQVASPRPDKTRPLASLTWGVRDSGSSILPKRSIFCSNCRHFWCAQCGWHSLKTQDFFKTKYHNWTWVELLLTISYGLLLCEKVKKVYSLAVCSGWNSIQLQTVEQRSWLRAYSLWSQASREDKLCSEYRPMARHHSQGN